MTARKVETGFRKNVKKDIKKFIKDQWKVLKEDFKIYKNKEEKNVADKATEKS